MISKKKLTGLALAFSAASLFALAPVAAFADTAMDSGPSASHAATNHAGGNACKGVNGCNGNGSCKSKHHAKKHCKHHHHCKGKKHAKVKKVEKVEKVEQTTEVAPQ